MTVQPLGNRVLIKPVEKDDKTHGGIIMPGTVQADMLKGVVVDVGWDTSCPQSVKEANLSVSVRDTILYPRGHGRQVEIDGVKHFVLENEHVIAKVIRKDEATLN